MYTILLELKIIFRIVTEADTEDQLLLVACCCRSLPALVIKDQLEKLFVLDRKNWIKNLIPFRIRYLHVSFSNESSEFGSLWWWCWIPCCGCDASRCCGFVELLFLSDFQNKNTREIKSKVNTKRTTNTIELLWLWIIYRNIYRVSQKK